MHIYNEALRENKCIVCHGRRLKMMIKLLCHIDMIVGRTARASKSIHTLNFDYYFFSEYRKRHKSQKIVAFSSFAVYLLQYYRTFFCSKVVIITLTFLILALISFASFSRQLNLSNIFCDYMMYGIIFGKICR